MSFCRFSIKKYISYIALCLSSSCFCVQQNNITRTTFEDGEMFVQDPVVLDLEQNVNAFSPQLNTMGFTSAQQAFFNKRFDEAFVRVWFEPQESKPKTIKNHFYIENFHKLSDRELADINDNIKNGTHVKMRAILVNNSELKIFPTNHVLLYDTKKPGDTFPFDVNINSTAHVGTPVFVSAISKDKNWAFVSCCLCGGWIKMNDIAYVDDSFVSTYIKAKKLVAIREKQAIRVNGKNGQYTIATADIGTVLPELDKKMYFPFKDKNGFAELVECSSNEGFETKPISFSKENISTILSQMIRQTYGWGGVHNLRDCSSTMCDFFAAFGVLLSGDSKQQLRLNEIKVDKSLSFDENLRKIVSTYLSKRADNLSRDELIKILIENRLPLPLDGMSAKDKIKMIAKYGVPFRTLIGKLGHVMLYVGMKNGVPVVFHNVWGAPSKTADRYVIGKAVLMSLNYCKLGIRLVDIVMRMRVL